MKRSTTLVLLVLPAAVLVGCDGGVNPPPQRDVYASREDCLKDWNAEELCSTMDPEDQKKYVQANPVPVTGGGGGGGHVHPVYYFWGPPYHAEDRSVLYKGNVVAANTNNAMPTRYSLGPSASWQARTPPAGTTASPRAAALAARGGFGSTAHSGGGMAGG